MQLFCAVIHPVSKNVQWYTQCQKLCLSVNIANIYKISGMDVIFYFQFNQKYNYVLDLA